MRDAPKSVTYSVLENIESIGNRTSISDSNLDLSDVDNFKQSEYSNKHAIRSRSIISLLRTSCLMSVLGGIGSRRVFWLQLNESNQIQARVKTSIIHS